MTKLIIVRHGYSVSNKARTFTGQSDVPLDEVGYSQAEDVARYILKTYKIDRIYSSDLQRAYDTVKPLVSALKMPVQKEVMLREVDVGLWEEKTYDEVHALYPKNAELYKQNVAFMRFDGGESYQDMQKRGLAIIQKIANENDGKTVVIATHGGMIRVLLCAGLKKPVEYVVHLPSIPNASITTATFENGELTVDEIGYSEHLTNKIEVVPLFHKK